MRYSNMQKLMARKKNRTSRRGPALPHLMIRPVLALLVLAPPLWAQGLAGPAELPPAGYAAQSYTDSQGCVFLRAGKPGQEQWLPRVDDSGHPICPGAVKPEQAAPVAETAGTKAPAPISNGALFVQLGSFSIASNAQNLTKRLESKGIPAQSAVLGSGVTVVLAGPFLDSQAALAVLSDLRDEFPDAFIR